MFRRLDAYADYDDRWRIGFLKEDWQDNYFKWLFAIGPIRVGWMTDDYLDALEGYR